MPEVPLWMTRTLDGRYSSSAAGAQSRGNEYAACDAAPTRAEWWRRPGACSWRSSYAHALPTTLTPKTPNPAARRTI